VESKRIFTGKLGIQGGSRRSTKAFAVVAKTANKLFGVNVE
jgi:hypothetical protein